MQTNIPRKVNAGMWVVTADDRVGILVEVGPLAGVDLVDDNGDTLVQIREPFEVLRQARLADIPEPRRPSPQAGAALGYL